MKRLIISLLSTVALTTLAAPALAEKDPNIQSLASKDAATQTVNPISPFNLITSSYQGRFTSQGIPSNGVLLSGIRSNRIQAEDLVKAAIASNRLNESTLQDRDYLNSVDLLLQNLDRQ